MKGTLFDTPDSCQIWPEAFVTSFGTDVLQNAYSGLLWLNLFWPPFWLTGNEDGVLMLREQDPMATPRLFGLKSWGLDDGGEQLDLVHMTKPADSRRLEAGCCSCPPHTAVF
jgi:hypothetical protein